jgi:hypothetical protein
VAGEEAVSPRSPQDDAADWARHKELVLYRLDSVDAKLARIERTLASIEPRVAVLRARSAAWGAAAAALVSAVVAWLVTFVTGSFGSAAR